MTDFDFIKNSLEKLQSNIIFFKYAGYDPYDLLNSPLFDLPILKTNKNIRFLGQQVFRRIPINIRPLLGIKPSVNPVTLGLSVQAFTYLSKVFPENSNFYQKEIKFCIDKLNKLNSINYSGSCWGYNFDWEARYTKIDKFIPTVVATGIITNSLFENYLLLDNLESLKLCKSATNFVRTDLNKSYDSGYFCYSYSPVDNQKVFNASLKGARLLSQIYSVTKEEALLTDAKNLIGYVCHHQKENGSWAYSAGDARTWSDNYHTAYVLDCIDEYQKITLDFSFSTHLEKGFSFYKENFFLENGTPKYYDNKVYPIDATSGAQSILTLLRFRETEIAKKVSKWMIKNMQSNDGSFYYQKLNWYSHKTSYARWSNAWMFVALSSLLYKGFAYEKN